MILLSVASGLAMALGIQGGASPPSRLWQRVWDSGHILLFFLVAWGFGLRVGPAARLSAPAQLIALVVFTLVAGGMVELLQGLLGRPGNPSLDDMRRNLAGLAAGLAFAYPLPGLNRRRLRALRLITVAVVVLELTPVFSAWHDHRAAQRRFPVLADFDQAWQAHLWSPGQIVAWPGRGGVLRVPLRPSGYSGTQLLPPPADWGRYHALELSVYNPSPKVQRLELSLRDRAGQLRGGAYADRYNASRRLHPGWNRLSFSLNEAREAPATRHLDLQDLVQLDLFFLAPSAAFVLLDDVTLTPAGDHG